MLIVGSVFSNILNDFDIDFIKTYIPVDNYNDVEFLINQIKPTHLFFLLIELINKILILLIIYNLMIQLIIIIIFIMKRIVL